MGNSLLEILVKTHLQRLLHERNQQAMMTEGLALHGNEVTDI